MLNERECVENEIANHKVSKKPSETLNRLARYYYQEKYKEDDITKLLEDFMLVSYPNFNPVKWQVTLERQVKKAKKYPLIEIDFIPISKNELDTIKSIHNKPQERLAFTLLCLAKFGNAVNPQNNDWTNREDKEIFRMANIQVSIEKQSAMMNSLRNKGLIQYSRIVDNLNTNVLFIDNESEIVLEIEDYRNLGYEYALYCNENIYKCESCGALGRQNEKKNKKLCNECSKYQPQETRVIRCNDCDKEIVVPAWDMKTKRCDECQKLADYTPIQTKIIHCKDCGKEVIVDSKANNREYCDECAKLKWKEYNKEKQKEYYNKKKSV